MVNKNSHKLTRRGQGTPQPKPEEITVYREDGKVFFCLPDGRAEDPSNKCIFAYPVTSQRDGVLNQGTVEITYEALRDLRSKLQELAGQESDFPAQQTITYMKKECAVYWKQTSKTPLTYELALHQTRKSIGRITFANGFWTVEHTDELDLEKGFVTTKRATTERGARRILIEKLAIW